MEEKNNEDIFADNVSETDDEKDESSDISIYNLSIFPSDLTLEVYVNKVSRNDIEVPDFQRKFIWNINDSSKLIESFLLGLPVPGVFLYKRSEDNKLLIVDGHQRILSVYYFFKGTFKDEYVFKLRNVDKRWEGKTFLTLSEKDKRQLNDSILRATIIQQLFPNDNSSIYHIFERLNTGGKKLTPMEVRHCIYNGQFMNELEKLNKNKYWRKIIGQENFDQRYRDVEWILRVIALAEQLNEYEKPMKTFLSDFMKERRNNQNKATRENLALFELVCERVFYALGSKPFHIRKKMNYAVLDSILGVIITNFEKIDFKVLKKDFNLLIQDKYYLEYVTHNTSDTISVQKRFSIVNEKLVGK